VFIRYHSWSERATTEREVEPLSLTYGSGAWYFSAYCRLRQGIRAFRLDRVEMLKVLREHFSGEHAAQTSPAIPMSVEIRFPEGAARWVRERQHYAFVRETAAEPGFILMMYQVIRLDEIKHWLLSWGAEAEVIAPAPLRQMIRDEATKLLVLLT
jgi:predicted DNA-binding transcriptional regulator YafY